MITCADLNLINYIINASLCVGGSKGKAEIPLKGAEKRNTTEMYPRKVMHIIGGRTKDIAIPTHNVMSHLFIRLYTKC